MFTDGIVYIKEINVLKNSSDKRFLLSKTLVSRISLKERERERERDRDVKTIGNK